MGCAENLKKIRFFLAEKREGAQLGFFRLDLGRWLANVPDLIWKMAINKFFVEKRVILYFPFSLTLSL